MRASHFCRLALAVTVLAVPIPDSRAGTPAPKLAIASLAQLPIVALQPYDADAPAEADVDRAFARARRNGKRVLIELGGNWCGDCIVLDNLMLIPAMRTFLAAHYEVVMVDVGRFDKNLDIPARFHITQKLEGVPSVLVATPEGRLVNSGHTAALVDARDMTPQAIADWLARWTGK